MASGSGKGGDIFVGLLDSKVTETNLRDLFSEYGSLKKCKIIVKKKRQGVPHAFAFVRLDDVSKNNAAISGLDRKSFLGRNIKVQLRKPPNSRNNKNRNGKALAQPTTEKKRVDVRKTSDQYEEKEHYEEEGIQPAWYPPGAEAKRGKIVLFKDEIEPSFFVPKRLANESSELITAVNDFHFAMMNDLPRNEFYYNSLKAAITKDSTLVEIGLGSGLLSIIAATLGAKHVTGIEASRQLARLAQMNIATNNLRERVSVLNAMSTEIKAEHLKHGPVDILVSEILGTLLLSENALEFNHDAKRLLKKGGIVIPRLGTQFITLIESEKLDLITSARKWRGLDFRNFNTLKDTASLLFTKELGCRLCFLNPSNITHHLPIIEVDFAEDDASVVPEYKVIRTKAIRDGVIHAAIYSWEVYSDTKKQFKMSTHYEDTVDNFQRDLQWGQGIQILEDLDHMDSKEAPVPLVVKKGDDILLHIRIAQGGSIMQCSVRKIPPSSIER